MKTPRVENWGAVWIDHFKAIIILPKDHDCEISTLYSQMESKHKSTGGKGKSQPYMHETGPFSSQHFEGRQQNQLEKFYSEVSDALGDPAELLVIGIGRAPKEFSDEFLQDPRHRHIVVTQEKAEEMTMKQLQKRVMEHFGYQSPRLWPDMPGQPVRDSF
jgi:hypothetical protein